MRDDVGPPAEEGTVSRGFVVRGRVQGVGFRWWTQRQGRQLGLRGSVRNRPDGTVEVRAAGTLAELSALEARLRDGPPGSEVEEVEPFPAEHLFPAGFVILP
jgi:acylphosphatase